MHKGIQIALYIYFATTFAGFGYGFIFARDEIICATAYYVAPGNVERACAKFRESE